SPANACCARPWRSWPGTVGRSATAPCRWWATAPRWGRDGSRRRRRSRRSSAPRSRCRRPPPTGSASPVAAKGSPPSPPRGAIATEPAEDATQAAEASPVDAGAVTLHLYDTATRALREFTPVREGHASVYLCGATPQAIPHIGHVRSGVAFDILRRWLL